MRNAKTLLTSALILVALSACGQKAGQQNEEANIALDEGLPSGQVPANAEIEALPADESSVTPSNQLQNGIDPPEEDDSPVNAQ